MKSLHFLTSSFILFVLLNLNAQGQQFTELSTTQFTGVSDGKVSFGDYDNDGDLDIIINGDSAKLTNPAQYVPVTYIYQNNGNNSFQKLTNLNLSGIWKGKSTWIDIENDGDMDIVLMGANASNNSDVKVYLNNRDKTFTPTRGIYNGINCDISVGDFNNNGRSDILRSGNNSISIYWENIISAYSETTFYGSNINNWNCSVSSDYNNDGLLDFLVSGSGTTILFRSIGNDFEQDKLTFPHLSSSSADWGDYNNDGRLDLLISGSTSTGSISKIYKNGGSGAFSELFDVALPGVSYGSCAWGDYNNDGKSDFILTGQRTKADNTTESISKLFTNDGNDIFTETDDIFTGVTRSSVAWGDCDNDGDLDLLLAGLSLPDSTKVTKLYINNSVNKNTAPQIPTTINSVINNKSVTLSWNKSTDTETPQNGLSYNIRVGLASKGVNLVSPMSNQNGYRQIVAKGNTGLVNSYKIENISDGTYYWSVQAIDGGFLGSNFSTEGTFTIGTFPPTIAPRNITFTNVTAYTMKIKWEKGNAEKYVVFMKKGTDGTPTLSNNTYYRYGSFANGREASTGWYCVYNGNADNASVSGLEPETTYRTMVIGYNGLEWNEKYLIEATENNPLNQTTEKTPLVPSTISLTGVSSSSADFGDYDNDGDLDLIVAGDSIRTESNVFLPTTKLYENISNTYIEKKETNFHKLSLAFVKWGDYNNDGQLDLLLLGEGKTSIYKNNGTGSFTELTNTMLPTMTLATATWDDFNNDGYPDITVSNYSNNAGSTRLFKNNKDNTFKELTDTAFANFGEINRWADLDNDGDLDLIISGSSSSYKAAIYRNNDDETFTQVNTNLVGVIGGIKCGDYDNDGDLDIFSGSDNNNYFGLFLYENKGNFNFEKKILYTAFSPASIDLGDYNNDGYLDASYGYHVLDNKNGTFARNPNIYLGYISRGTDLWGDYDNDKDLDLFQTGYDFDVSGYNTRVARVINNKSLIANTPPSVPSEISYDISGNHAILRWKRSSDNETPALGLSYNFALNQIAGDQGNPAFNISPFSDLNNGYRKVIDLGNAQQDTFWIIKNIPSGSYQFKVQAIDNGFLGSAFSNGDEFTIDNQNFAQATNIMTSEIKSKSAKITWTNGGGEKRAVFIKNNTSKTVYPFNRHTYTGNSEFGKGTKTEFDGWYCIYNGTGNEVLAAGLSPLTEYRVMICEYTGNMGNETYSSTTALGNPIFFKTDNSTDVNDILSENILVYPNPAQDYIFIKGIKNDMVNVSVLDINGKIILNAKVAHEGEPLNIRNLPGGMYFVKLQIDNRTKYVKIAVIR